MDCNCMEAMCKKELMELTLNTIVIARRLVAHWCFSALASRHTAAMVSGDQCYSFLVPFFLAPR